MPEDYSLGEFWSALLKTESFAWHLAGLKTVVVRSDPPVSEMWQGLSLLHEVFHARNEVRFSIEAQRLRRHSGQEERDAYNFVNQLLLLLGGKMYKELLKTAAYEVRQKLKGLGHRIGNAMLSPESTYREESDHIFGAAQSDLEVTLRATSFGIHVNFYLLERYYSGEVEKRKAEYMRIFHEGKLRLPDRLSP